MWTVGIHDIAGLRVAASRAEKFRTARPSRVGKVVSNHNPGAACSREGNPIRMVRSTFGTVLIENIILNPRIITVAAPHYDASPIILVGNGVVGNDPITREGKIRSRMHTRVVLDCSVQLDACAKVIVKEIVCERDCRAMHIYAVRLIADGPAR